MLTFSPAKSLSLYSIRVFILYSFVFSLPFDQWQALHIVPSLTLNKFFGLLYASLSILSSNRMLSINRGSQPTLLLLFLWAVFLISNVMSLVSVNFNI